MRLRSSVAVAVAQAGSCTSDSSPSLGTSICCRYSPKKQKQKKPKKTKKTKPKQQQQQQQQQQQDNKPPQNNEERTNLFSLIIIFFTSLLNSVKHLANTRKQNLFLAGSH